MIKIVKEAGKPDINLVVCDCCGAEARGNAHTYYRPWGAHASVPNWCVTEVYPPHTWDRFEDGRMVKLRCPGCKEAMKAKLQEV